MNRISSRLVLLLALVPLGPALVKAQQKAKPAGEEWVVKVYRVVDLVSPVPNYPYEGTYLPQMQGANKSSSPVTSGMGVMGGGMGGGMFQVPDRLAQVGPGAVVGGGGGGERPAQNRPGPSQETAISMDQLIDAIKTVVEPESWDDVGGPGSISQIGGALAIRQTPAIQSKVQEFLDALKRESGALRMITIRARWFLLDDEQRAGLAEKPDAKQPPSTGQTLDAKALAALPTDAERYAGQITCFNGQMVHIVSGRIESVVGGAIPVVGGTQVGYQPVMLSPHLGILLQITPSALPDGDGVLVDLHSSVTRWEKSAKAAHIGTTPDSDVTIEVDRINVTAQQLSTSLRMPLDKPVLVGGISFPGDGSRTEDGPPAEKSDLPGGRAGLYLVIEVHSTGA
ncbi:MAG: hypothetical protein WD063_12225 [Pirellulales bacterium]